MADSHGTRRRDRALDRWRHARPHGRRTRRRALAGEIARYLGAVSILVVGAIHAQQYYDAYFYVVPTIGTLFLLSFIGAARRRRRAVRAGAATRPAARRPRSSSLAALGAIGIALGTLVSLLISEYMPLFGFMESGYRLAIVLTLVFDVLTTAFLGVFLVIVGPQLIRNTADEPASQ